MLLLCSLTLLCPLCPVLLSFSFEILTLPLICMQPSSTAPGICQLSCDQVTAVAALAFVSAPLSVLYMLFLPNSPKTNFLLSFILLVNFRVQFIKYI